MTTTEITNDITLAVPVNCVIMPLSECKLEHLRNGHAFVFGRCKIWHTGLSALDDREWHWSKTTWWLGMNLSHRGGPEDAKNWTLYTDYASYTGVGDAEITHFMTLPDDPTA